MTRTAWINKLYRHSQSEVAQLVVPIAANEAISTPVALERDNVGTVVGAWASLALIRSAARPGCATAQLCSLDFRT
ncbi:hypothetical protein SBV1_1430018 [Verrucomicrobia bacterium]|nr:hypothetical protein SBV1_1430018 [Verrucomicrobiota bacterium]